MSGRRGSSCRPRPEAARIHSMSSREIRRPTGDGPPRQQVVEERRREGDPVRRGDGLAPDRVGEVDPVHDGLDDAAGDELVQPHERVVAGPDRVRGQSPRLGDRLGERLGEHARHVAGLLAFHHRVGVVVDDGGDLRAREDEEADVIAAWLAGLLVGDEHASEPDGDVEVSGQLEHRPRRPPGLERLELGIRPPVVLGQAGERVADALQLALEQIERLFVRSHRAPFATRRV